MSSTIMIHSTGKDLKLKFSISKNGSGEEYPALDFEIRDGYKRDVSLNLFPSFAQVQEIYNALGKYLEEVNIQKMAAEFEAKEEFPFIIQKYLKFNKVDDLTLDITKGKEYPILNEDSYGRVEIRDDVGDFRYFTVLKYSDEMEVIEKEIEIIE